jgi:L-rhamnose mutarotase
MHRYCLTLDLKNDPELIKAYEDHHKAIWPEITKSIKDSGITDMQIYRFGTRLFMIMEVVDNFSFEQKAKMDAANPKVQEWENLMLTYQQPFEGAGQKWVLMDKIFQL